jgi:hypothetical protein
VILAVAFSTFAQDTITNIMSPIASYQYPDDFSSESLTNGGVISPFVSYQYLQNVSTEALTNGGIMSPILSYQYYEWPGNGILNLQSSPVVSYYYQFLDAPVLNIVSTSRTPTTAETTPAYLLSPPPPSQLMAYLGGIFTANLASIDPNQMTIVLTHGWIPLNPLTGDPLFRSNGVDDWPINMASLLRANGITSANILAWDWKNAASSSLSDPKQAGGQTPQEGIALGQALLSALGSSYSGKVHFIGHSFGTLVNAYAANFLHGDRWANEPVSPTPWAGTDALMTLFDEAEVGADKDFNLNQQDITDLEALAAALAGENPDYLTLSSPYYHPLPKQCAWADNYVSAFGLLLPNAANVILTNGFPTDAPDPLSWFYELGSFHEYPAQWYEETIQTDNSAMGFIWSLLWSIGDPAFANAPTAGSVYLQAFENSQWHLTAKDWNFGTSWVNARFQEYRSGIITSVNNEVPGLVTANGLVNGQIVGALPAFDAFILSFFTTSIAHDPAYAWMQLAVPTNAVSMSFDYIIRGDWADDSLAAAFNGTNVLLIAGSEIQTNITFSSGSIDVSAFQGQTNELFIGIVGGTSTNAQLTVENLAFSVSSPPSLQVQVNGSNLMLSWPMSAHNFSLQTTTNLGDPNSWVTLTNVPSIVNVQNTVTNPIAGSEGFYRLIQSQ